MTVVLSDSGLYIDRRWLGDSWGGALLSRYHSVTAMAGHLAMPICLSGESGSSVPELRADQICTYKDQSESS